MKSVVASRAVFHTRSSVVLCTQTEGGGSAVQHADGTIPKYGLAP